MELAPIALFVYNRPSHTAKTLEALAKNILAKDSVLYVFQDGPKKESTPDQLQKIAEVDEVIKGIEGFKEVICKKRTDNIGLAESIIDGVTSIVTKHGKIIVLEDDIITSPYFLDYLNEGLRVYKDVDNVYAINAYMFPINCERATAVLCPLGTSTWGWATWASKWKAFEYTPIHKITIQQNKHLRARFNIADYNYADMLDNTNSWGIRWYYSVFMRNGLGVFPTKSLCYNIGFGNDSTHTRQTIEQMDLYMFKIPVELCSQVDIEIYTKLLNFFTSDRRPPSKGMLSKVLKKFKRLFLLNTVLMPLIFWFDVTDI